MNIISSLRVYFLIGIFFRECNWFYTEYLSKRGLQAHRKYLQSLYFPREMKAFRMSLILAIMRNCSVSPLPVRLILRSRLKNPLICATAGIKLE